jgi:hypothetical protein
MKATINRLKKLLAGKWAGEGFAKFPTIDYTAYTEQTEFNPDEYKDSIFFAQKAWYKNETDKNGHTVFGTPALYFCLKKRYCCIAYR